MNLLRQYIETTTGLTQADLARRLGHDRHNFNRIVNGLAKPTLDLAVALERETQGAVPVDSWATPSPNVALVRSPAAFAA